MRNIYTTLRQAIMILLMSACLVCANSMKAAVQVVTFSERPAGANFTQREIELPQFNQARVDSSHPRFELVKATGHTILSSDQELMQFSGSGLIDLVLSERSGFGHISLGREGVLNGLWVAGADIRLTYFYTAVPENSTWLAGAFALVLVVLARRSRSQGVSSVD